MSELVYVIGSEEHGTPFKIGKSKTESLQKRIKSLQTGNPLTLKSFYEFDSSNNDAYALEKKIRDELVKNYGYKKLKGEWIDINAKNPIDKIGDDITEILKSVNYDYKKDPAYLSLVKKNKILKKSLNCKFNNFINQHKFIFNKLKEYKKMQKEIEELNDKQNKLLNKIKKYRKLDCKDYTNNCKHEELKKDREYYYENPKITNQLNLMEWLMVFYDMFKKSSYPALHHKQGYSNFDPSFYENFYIVLGDTRYKFDIKRKKMSHESIRQNEYNREFISKCDLQRFSNWGEDTYSHQICLEVDENFLDKNIKSCLVYYNNKSINFINKDYLEGRTSK
jgi:hypothetical protein|tara:strand:- start:1487 stop:2494 length:1008 start_codon:yes stop_codon:yes gene_type:complete